MDSAASSGDQPSVFHYTRAPGLLSIIDSGTLWASDSRFLNDSQEIAYGIAVVKLAIEQETDGESALWNAVCARLGSAAALAQMYVACFCDSSDILSQWRTYGTGHGYCIEVDTAGLRSVISSVYGIDDAGDHAIKRVEYGPEELRPFVHHAVTSAPGEIPEGPDVIDGMADVIVAALVVVASSVKHPAFEEEREWRVMIEPRAMKRDIEIEFRATDVAIVPYISVPLPHEVIRSITIGPGGNVSTRKVGIERLLQERGLDVPVFLSEAPLRS